jgi:hypothetical protein
MNIIIKNEMSSARNINTKDKCTSINPLSIITGKIAIYFKAIENISFMLD